MRKRLWIGGVGLAALLVAGCNKASEPSNTTLSNNDLFSNEAGTTDNGSEAAPVAVAPVPAPPAGVPAADAAPLEQASQAASEIASGTDVERIPYDGGWAWRRHGQIIRTASRDGRVSYFRPGETNPYLVQQGDRAFAYANGRVARSYDRQGRPAQPDAKQRDEGQHLAQQSAQERDQARQVAARQPQRVQRERPQPAGDRSNGNASSNAHEDQGKGGHASAAHGDRTPSGADGQNPDNPHRDRNDHGG